MDQEKKDYQYAIIGNSAAGLSALKAIRSIDAEGSAAVLTFEKDLNYSKPLISYFLARKVPLEKVYFKQKDFYRENKADLLLEHRVEKIDFDQKTITVNGTKKIGFRKLLISSGGNPIIPGIRVQKGSDAFFLDQDNIKAIDGVFTLTTLQDAREIRQYIEENQIKEAVVLGGGLIGIKSLEAMLDLDIKVHLVELADRILPGSLDRQASSLLEETIKGHGSQIHLCQTVSQIDIQNDQVRSVLFKDGSKTDCRLLIIAVGVKPNTAFIQDEKILTDRGILVDAMMQTSIPDVYAAGDVACSIDMIREDAANIAIWPLAVRQGTVAGQNMAQDRSKGRSEYQGGFAMNSVEMLGLPCISMGISNLDEEAVPDSGYEFLREYRKDRRTYKKIIVRDDRIIGAILIGHIDRAGIYHGLIKNRIDVSSVKDIILKEDFGIIQLPGEYKKHLVVGEGIEV